MLTQLVRAHRAPLLLAFLFNLILFAPLFEGRILSPNDVYQRFEPWASQREAGEAGIQNPLLVDPPTSWYTLISLIRSEPGAFHWNPYIAAGVHGFGSSAAAVLSPFVLLPALALPLPWIYTGIVFLHCNVAFLFAYLWLREESLPPLAAATGAVVLAGSGIYSVRWLWQMSNATALYPMLLWIVRRTANGRPITPVWLVPLALAYALAGFPSAMAYGLYLAVAYGAFLAIRRRSWSLRAVATIAGAFLAALAIASPSLAPFGQWILESGYLQDRESRSGFSYPLAHWANLIMPERLGHPAKGTWRGDPALFGMNNFVEATLYLGLASLLLAAVALFRRRITPSAFFFTGAAVLILACLFGMPLLATGIAQLPGFRYSTLTRASALLPPAIGMLAACGVSALLGAGRSRLAMLLAVAATIELAWFALRFHPYLPIERAGVPSSPAIELLQRDRAPFRIAPFFDWLWPNSAELFRLEDVRSHFTSTPQYRRLLQRLDPQAWKGGGNYLGFDSTRFRFDDPIAAMLGIRWFIEPRSMDIVRWQALARTVPALPQGEDIALQPGSEVSRVIPGGGAFWAMELPAAVQATDGEAAHVTVELDVGGSTVWSRVMTPNDLRAIGRIYVPWRPLLGDGDVATVRVRSSGVTASFAGAADGGLFFGEVHTPVVYERLLPDGRLFRNLAEVPRFHPVSRVLAMKRQEFLEWHAFDPWSEAVMTGGASNSIAFNSADARVEIAEYTPSRSRLLTSSSHPFFLATSEKLSRELQVTIDGKAAEPVEIHTMFAGLAVPAGRHELTFRRRLGATWWPVSLAGFSAWMAMAAVHLLRRRERRPLRSSPAPGELLPQGLRSG